MENAGGNSHLTEPVDRLLGCLLSGAVAVVGDDHFLGKSGELSGVFRRDRRSQRRHHIGKAGLVDRDHVHISFRQNHDRGRTVLGEIEGEQIAALVEHRCFCRVQILWLSVVQHSAAEADHSSPRIHNGEHHTSAKGIIQISFVRTMCHICQKQFFLCESLLQQVVGQGIPAV